MALTVFTLASAAGGFAPNGPVLIVARIVQGAGAAIAAPCALSLLATTFPAGPARTKALGVYICTVNARISAAEAVAH